MVRFKVIRGGTILMVVACIALLAAVCFVVSSAFSAKDSTPAATTGAEAVSAFALPLSPSIAYEDEHTDQIAGMYPEIVTEVLPVTNGKRILIYHTHTHEAYKMEPGDEYVPLEDWRTDDNEHNIVRVGSELAEQLRARGFYVVHDTTDNEQAELSTAYQRSYMTLSGYNAEHFDMYIDLHRDAYTEGSALTCTYAGSEAARLMLLIGKGESFSEKPYFAENYAFAGKLTEAVNSICPGLCRDVLVKTGRYNQHIAPDSVLIEAGSNMNTLAQALNAMPILAEAISEVLRDDGEIMMTSSTVNN